jgi:uncharacterized protein YdhG (YjbR/CyaY superfamily)
LSVIGKKTSFILYLNLPVMTATKAQIANIDEYISGFPEKTQKILERIRVTVKDAAPDAFETIKYSMPTFVFKGNLIHFAAYKNHIGMYPIPVGDNELSKALDEYKTEKSTLRFPLDKPIPFDLISKIIKLRVKQRLENEMLLQTKK